MLTPYRRVCIFFCTAAGVFVHCWTSLLSPICCGSLAWKQGQESFHTYTHWPLINKSDPWSIPTHTHRYVENKEHTHTDTDPNHRNNPEHTLVRLDHTSRLTGSELATQMFVYEIWQRCDVSIAFYFKWWPFPCGTVKRTQGHLFPSAVLLFCFHGMNWH